MLHLTRLDNSIMLINPEHIEIVDSTPDTIITLINNKKIIVKNTPQDIKQQFIDYQREIRIPLDQKIT
ncbi:MAG: hypothetical protein ACD_79C00700G0003, partial [uncultured bacterium]